MRAIWDSEVPGACDNSVLIGERVQPYEDVWQHRDRMPIFPVPEGETQASWLHKEVMRASTGVSRPGRRASTSSVPSTRSASSTRWASPPTSSWSATSSITPARSGSGWARVEARRPARSSRTRWVSPTSTPSRTGCCSSGSSTPNACRCPISISTSTIAVAARWSATPPTSGAATRWRRSSRSAPSRPRPPSRTPRESSSASPVSPSPTRSPRRCRRDHGEGHLGVGYHRPEHERYKEPSRSAPSSTPIRTSRRSTRPRRASRA